MADSLQGSPVGKVCVVGFSSPELMPYCAKYIKFIERMGMEYDLIVWDRDAGTQDGFMREGSQYTFEYGINTASKLKKIPAFYRWRKGAAHILRSNRYDRVIVLTTLPAVLLYPLLTRQYRGRFLLDIRDYTLEALPPYRMLVNRLARSAALTALSSEGYYEFIQAGENTVLNHNLPDSDPQPFDGSFRKGGPVVIGYAGNTRYFQQNVRLLEAFRGRPRYSFLYAGKPTPGCNLEEYCRTHSIANARFTGYYEEARKAELYRGIDVVNCLCGNDSPLVRLPMANRLYDAALYRKPILVTSGTHMAKVVQQYGLGLCLRDDMAGAADLLDTYFKWLTPGSFVKGCDAFLSDVRRDEEIFFGRLQAFLAHA